MDKKYILGLILLVAIALGVVLLQKNSDPAGSGDQAGGTSNTDSSTPTPAASKSTKKTPASQVFTYEETVERYVNQRVQFDANCLANPTSVTFKSGTQVMFDNRSNEKRTVSLDGTGYVIGPYGYIILPLSSKTLPHTVKVDCGGQKNVAQILLQK